ncbi:hypothetical protein CRP13_gp53 [Roseobacter phage CRP-13]|nr:hypothetical protein CRP13_gp53 [Roseobacter phage CRP-13]
MEIKEYQMSVLERFKALPDEDKDLLLTLRENRVGAVLGVVLGPELGTLVSPTEDLQPMQQTQEVTEEPVVRPGLGAR